MTKNFARFLSKQSTVIFTIAIAFILLIVMSIIKPEFGTIDHINTLLVDATTIGLFALGQTLVVLTGGIDLSIPWTMNCAAVMLSCFANGTNKNLLISTIAILLGCTFVGFINGVGVSYLNMHPMIMTFGMNSILSGVLLAFLGGQAGGFASPFLTKMLVSKFFGLSSMLYLWLFVMIVASVLLAFTPFGRKLYALGNSQNAAYFSGVNVKLTKTIAYCISGFTAGLGGILILGKVGQAYLGMGDYVMFETLAIVAVGGASLNGGRGNYMGTVGGTLIITILLSMLTTFKISAGMQQMLYGIVLLAAVIIAKYNFKFGKKSPVEMKKPPQEGNAQSVVAGIEK